MHGSGIIPTSEANEQKKNSASTSPTLLIHKSVGAKPSSIAKHACILMPVELVHGIQFSADAGSSSCGLDSAKAVFRADMIAHCDFQIIRGWDGIESSAIRLMCKSHLQGQQIHFFVLEYVGVEYNAISLLQKCRGDPSAALFQYLSTHCEHPSIRKAPSSQRFNKTQELFAFHGIRYKDVEATLVKQQIQLSHDQRRAIAEISNLRRHVIGLRGPPGASKTTLAVGIFLLLSRELAPNQKILWLTKTRKQRMKALNEFRPFMALPLLMIHLD